MNEASPRIPYGLTGAGRTSALPAIMGLTGRRAGLIRVNDVESIALQTFQVAHLGVGYCSQERGIFSSPSTEENQMLPRTVSRTEKGMSIEENYAMFPNLAERRHSQGIRLSGGERQMLAVARSRRTGDPTPINSTDGNRNPGMISP